MKLKDNFPFDALFVFNANLDLYINSTSTDQVYRMPEGFARRLKGKLPPEILDVLDADGTSLTVPAGAPHADGTFGTPGPYLVIAAAGELKILNTFNLDGSFRIEVSPDGFQLDVHASLNLNPLGTVAADGTLHFGPDGAYGALELAGAMHVGPLTIVGAASLEINKTDADVIIQRHKFDFVQETVSPDLVDVTLPADSFSIFVGGKLKLTDSFVIAGTFKLEDQSDVLTVDINGQINLFGGASLTVDAVGKIYKTDNPGLVLIASARLDANLVPGVFSLNASAHLLLNTRSVDTKHSFVFFVGTVEVNIPRDTFRIDFDGSMKLFNTVTITEATGMIEYTGGVFRMDVGVGVDFGVVKASGRAFFSSEGEFQLDLHGELNLGVKGFGIFGTGDLTISYLDSNGTAPFGSQNKQLYVYGSAKVRLDAFGITLVGLGLGVEYDEAKGGEFGVTAEIVIVGIRKKAYFAIGRISTVNVEPRLAYQSDQSLILSVGKDRYLEPDKLRNRNVAPFQTSEAYFIDEDEQAFIIKAFGYERQYPKGNVAQIVGDFTDDTHTTDLEYWDGTDYLEVSPNVTVPVFVTMGKNATIIHNGKRRGYFTIEENANIEVGSTNADGVQISAGDTARISLKGGDGDNQRNYVESGKKSFIDASQAKGGLERARVGNQSTVYGTAFDDLMIGGSDVTLYGNAGNDDLSAASGINYLDGGVGDDTITGGSGADTIVGGDGADNLTGNDGADIIYGGADNDTITGGAGDLWLDGGGGVNTLKLRYAGNTVLLQPGSANADGAVTPFQSFPTVTVDLHGDLTIDGPTLPLSQINAGDGDDKITIRALGATVSPVTINLGKGNDTLTIINSLAALDVYGGDNTNVPDTLIVDRSAMVQPLTGSLSATKIRELGLGTITYQDVESVQIRLGQGADKFRINGTRLGVVGSVFGQGDADQFTVGDGAPLDGRITLNGGDGSDTLTVEIAGDANELTEDTFEELGFDVDQLVVDNHTGAAVTHWQVKDRVVYVDGTELLDGLGPTRSASAAARIPISTSSIRCLVPSKSSLPATRLRSNRGQTFSVMIVPRGRWKRQSRTASPQDTFTTAYKAWTGRTSTRCNSWTT